MIISALRAGDIVRTTDGKVGLVEAIGSEYINVVCITIPFEGTWFLSAQDCEIVGRVAQEASGG